MSPVLDPQALFGAGWFWARESKGPKDVCLLQKICYLFGFLSESCVLKSGYCEKTFFLEQRQFTSMYIKLLIFWGVIDLYSAMGFAPEPLEATHGVRKCS